MLTLGVSAFALTHTISSDEVDLIRMVHGSDIPFVNARLVAGVNYRY